MFSKVALFSLFALLLPRGSNVPRDVALPLVNDCFCLPIAHGDSVWDWNPGVPDGEKNGECDVEHCETQKRPCAFNGVLAGPTPVVASTVRVPNGSDGGYSVIDWPGGVPIIFVIDVELDCGSGAIYQVALNGGQWKPFAFSCGGCSRL